jgi:glycosyltransferase involved in cell wall biosynthesis
MPDILNETALIKNESLFWSPDYLDVSAWIEHIPFAFWIIETIKPKVVVELGVHKGTSYFAFCQAVKSLNLNTVCYGVDTWQGDEHAGFYDEATFAKVAEHNDKQFARFSTLISSTFDEAREYFIDGTVELLHIDGLHTYEAVKHDFETWLPKLTPNAFVVFHDINVRERNFGVFKLWEELQKKYQNFQFNFGHGLGILTIGNPDIENVIPLFKKETNNVYYSFLRNLFADRGHSFKSKLVFEHTLKGEREKNAAQASAYLNLEQLHKSLESIHNQLKENFEALAASNEQLKENFKGLELHNVRVEEGNKSLSQNYEQLLANFKGLEQHNIQLENNYKSLSGHYVQLQKNIEGLELHKQNLEKKNETLKAEIDLLSSDLKAIREKIENADMDASVQKELIHNLNDTLNKQQQALDWYKATYEDRSLLGTIREKLSSSTRKVPSEIGKATSQNVNGKAQASLVNGYSKKNVFEIVPAHDIKYDQLTKEYTSYGSDPYFIVDLKGETLKEGWYWLSINMEVVGGSFMSPRLYFNCGRGFNEEDGWDLPGIKDDKIESLVKFPASVTELRFDPTIHSCVFKINAFSFKSINKVKAFQIALADYKQGEFAKSGYPQVFAALFASYLKGGKKEFKKKIRDAVYKNEKVITDQYGTWCKLYDTITNKDIERIKELFSELPYQPLFSIIMPVFNAPVDFLEKAIASVQAQAYANWELCIADDKSTDEAVIRLLKKYEEEDARIKIVYRAVNGHISKASNSALEVATGEFMVLLDQDDELRPHSLYMVAKALNENSDLAIIYSDEDKINEQGERYDPYFKTNWNKDLFYSQNFINHLGVYRLSLIKKIKGFRETFEGSQDYDLALRCIEHLHPQQIHHIPHVLYHWRAIANSTAATISNKGYAYEAGIKALNDHLRRTEQDALAVENINNSYRVKWNLPEQKPLVSIIIPTKDKVDILSNCITSILEKTHYNNYEVLVIDNNSGEAATHAYYKKIQLAHPKVKLYPYNKEFNFSAIINYGVEKSEGDVIILLNNDTEVINEEWLGEMVSHCLRKEIGAVGAKLYYPNGQIQHAGVFLYDGHPGNHIYLKREKDDPGYFNKLNLIQNYSAVTAACLAIRKEVYIEANGCDEENLKVAYNDVDLCLKVRDLGYRNLWTPFSELTHYESLSRGDDFNEANYARFKSEQGFMLKKWADAMSSDPYFNPNLAIDTHINRFAFPPGVQYDWQLKGVAVH